MSENPWDRFAEIYDTSVYAPTAVPEKRNRIVRELHPHDRNLIIGCGSDTYLQQQILETHPRSSVIALDWSQQMLLAARAKFSHPQLQYLRGDMTQLPLDSGSIDNVISTNSLILKIRALVRAAQSEVARVLRPGGKGIFYLPSYTCSEDIALKYPEHLEYMDPEQFRVIDTTGPQCFHTIHTIRDEFTKAGFVDLLLESVGIDNEAERAQLMALYGAKGEMFWEFFLRAQKPCGFGEHVELARPYRIENHDRQSLEKNPVLVRGIADTYRRMFSNQNCHYVIFPRTLEFLAPEQILHDLHGKYLHIGAMDRLAEFPQHPQTGETGIFWHDRETTEACLRQKFQKECRVSLIQDDRGGLFGMTFGYFAEIKKIFEMEGWRNPLNYAGIERPEHCRDIKRCLRILSEFLGLEIQPDQEFFCYNCVAIDPELHASNLFKPLVQNFLNSLPRDKRDILVLSEVTYGSKSHQVYAARGMKIVPGILNSSSEPQYGDSVLAVSYLPDLLRGFGVA